MAPWDDPRNPYRRRRGKGSAPWVDIMQVCENGHQITSFAHSQPASKKKRCPACGSPTLMACPGCGTRIPGHEHHPDGVSIGVDPVPAFCENCGQPYPWTVKEMEHKGKPGPPAETTSPALDALVSAAEAKRRRARARENWSIIYPSLLQAGEGSAAFVAESMRRELGRDPEPEEAAREWSHYFSVFGSRLAEIDGVSWTDQLPEETEEQGCAKELCQLACRPDSHEELLRRLAQLHSLEKRDPDFRDRFRDNLRRCVDFLTNRAREAFGPSSGSSASAAGEEPEGAGASPPPATEPGELPRELIQNYLLGNVQLTPEQQRQYLDFDPSEAVEELHPEAEFLRKWAEIAVIQGKFPPGWWSFAEECRGWRIPVDGEPNNWLPAIEHCMQELFGGPVGEKEIIGYLFKRHQLSPSQAAALSLPKLANILRKDLESRTKGSDREKAMTEPEGSRKVFLSHKSKDKPRVRPFCEVLKMLGFDPWLDEENLHAGTELERGLLQGLKDSCAAVFFITAAYKDENFLASEINYAIAEKRAKKERFAIITIVFPGRGESKPVVPELLRPYVWKTVKTDLEALMELLKALPLKIPPPEWK